MELKLQQFIESNIGLADIRNLSENNPIQITHKNPNSGDNVIVVVAMKEPHNYPSLPVNVTWINYDTEDVNFKKALKRVSRDDPGSGSIYEHTWETLTTYNSVFEPPQVYDGGFSDIEERFDFHLDTENNPNPHQMSAEDLGALQLSGGTLTGPVIARALGPGDSYDSGELIPKVYVDGLISQLNDEIQTLQNQLNAATVTTFKHEQQSPSISWAITHNLGSEDLIVQVYDANGYMMLPNNVQSTGTNTVVVSFEEQLTGTAVMIPVGVMPSP